MGFAVTEPKPILLHIAPIDRWEAAIDIYTDPSLDAEGFLHCSTPDQVLIPANERFHGRTDLVLLVIDSELVDADVVFEDCYESGTKFPHIYGPLPTSAVTKVVPFPPTQQGTFERPSLE